MRAPTRGLDSTVVRIVPPAPPAETRRSDIACWISLGRFKEAEDESRRALECDPLNFSIGSHEAFLKYEAGSRSRPLILVPDASLPGERRH